MRNLFLQMKNLERFVEGQYLLSLADWGKNIIA